MPLGLSVAIAFVYGAVVGSFLNVVIWRLPREESIVRPPSHCPACGYTLRAWDNIPLVTWLLYRGRCRKCHAPISVRYFVVELGTALLWVALLLKFGWSVEFFQFAALLSTLIAVFAIDLELYIIPDQLWIFAAAIGFVADGVGIITGARSFPWQDFLWVSVPFTHGLEIPVPQSLLGFFAYGALVLVVGILGEAAFKKDAMGGGDVKLTAAIGANIGVVYGYVSFFLAAGIGAVAGLALMALGRKKKLDEIPFGPMLVLGAAVMVFCGPQIIHWWLRYAGLE